MGLGGISPWSLLLILLIVLVIFGGRRLRSLGGDLGGALRGFRSAMRDGDDDAERRDETAPPTIERRDHAGAGERDAERER